MLLLLKILSWAQNEGKCPLELPAIKLLSAASQCRNDPTDIAWSYDTHVVAPLHVLQFIDASGTDIAFNVLGHDGQMINALLHIIDRQLHLSTQQSCRKVYDKEGILTETSINYNNTPTMSESNREDSSKTPTTYYGKLNPLCDLLSVASDPKLANVELVDLGDNRIICKPLALPTQNKSAIVIPKEQPLFLASRSIRSATLEERQIHRRDAPSDDSYTDTEAEVEDTLMAFVDDREDESMLDLSDTSDHGEDDCGLVFGD